MAPHFHLAFLNGLPFSCVQIVILNVCHLVFMSIHSWLSYMFLKNCLQLLLKLSSSNFQYWKESWMVDKLEGGSKLSAPQQNIISKEL